MSANIAKAIAVTAELLGTDLSSAAMMMMVEDLSAYPEPVVLQALVRCRREVTGRLTLAAIIERVQGADGRPGSDEAWAIAICAHDEQETVVWTREIASAFYVAASPLLEIGDKVAARMAFREAYDRAVDQARQSGVAPEWTATLGTCPVRRKEAIERSVERRLLTADRAKALLPAVKHEGPDPVAALIQASPVAMIANDSPSADRAESIAAKFSSLRKVLNRGAAA